MGRGDRFRRLKHRFENRRPSLSRLRLGRQIRDPLEQLGASVFESIQGIPTNRKKSNIPTTAEEGAAFDSVVVEASDGKLHHAGDDDSYSFSVAFSRWNSLRLGESNEGEDDDGDGDGDDDDVLATTMVMKLQILETDEVWFAIHKADDESEEKIHADDNGKTPWEELKPHLKEGGNPVAFFCVRQNRIQCARANIWRWKACDRVVISDIDGTLTKSNARGVLGTILTQNYDNVVHAGVCDLLSRLANSHTKTILEAQMPTTRILYLTSRPIHLANKTRNFLSGLTQPAANDSDTLPQGPILGFGGNLAKVLSMEVLSKSSQAFKANELERHIAGPFRRATEVELDFKMFVAAFGNNLNDVQAYHKSGVDLDKIFLIDKNSKIVTFQADDNEPPLREEGFPPHSWYNDRISAVFQGYCDTKLHSFLGMIDE